MAAANVCDAVVLNKAGDPEPAFAGGGWYRYENRPADVGKVIDQAGDFMLYETADGKIGIHAGAWVEPDITLDEAAIVSLSLDVNARQSTTCVAVRGRYTSIDHDYNTVDAAVYGDPYAPDDERTLTIDNTWVQRHNHMARLQKLAYIRANARRVSIVAHYEAAQNIPGRRFVRIDVPPRLDNVVVEVVGRPRYPSPTLRSASMRSWFPRRSTHTTRRRTRAITRRSPTIPCRWHSRPVGVAR
jgi:hypothetical protein